MKKKNKNISEIFDLMRTFVKIVKRRNNFTYRYS